MAKLSLSSTRTKARQAIIELRDAGCEALAICCLWSFLEPKHELRIKALALELAPALYITCSSELAPKWGEYERTTAVALNAYIGPVTVGYVTRLDRQLKETGLKPPLQITQCAGGTITVRKAQEAPLLTLDSGPVAGVTGSVFLGQLMNTPNIITTDLGGTSFDVGVIHNSAPIVSYKSLVHQYEYFLPKVDVQTLGTGGGSKVPHRQNHAQSARRTRQCRGPIRVRSAMAKAAPYQQRPTPTLSLAISIQITSLAAPSSSTAPRRWQRCSCWPTRSA